MSIITFIIDFLNGLLRGRATLKRAIAHVSKPHHTSMDELHRRVGLDCHECLLRARTRFLDSVWRQIKEQHISGLAFHDRVPIFQ